MEIIRSGNYKIAISEPSNNRKKNPDSWIWRVFDGSENPKPILDENRLVGGVARGVEDSREDAIAAAELWIEQQQPPAPTEIDWSQYQQPATTQQPTESAE